MTPLEIISLVLDTVKQIVACCRARERYFDDLTRDVKKLDSEMRLLNDVQEHLKTRVRREMKQHMQQDINVTLWLNRVNRLKEDVDSILREAKEEDRNKNLRFICPKNCCSFDRLGTEVKEKLQEVADLMSGSNFEQLVDINHHDLVVEMPMEKTVGLECTFKEVRGHMEDTSIGVIGLLGMGGVGKTTLLKMMNNSIYEACKKGEGGKIGDSSKNNLCSFDLVIWVKVSKEGGVRNIQESIFKKLGIPEEDWKDKSESERAEEIWRLLRGYKFALLLDDLWKQTDDNERLDLSRVKVPADCNNNGSKVVFTTRHEMTCRVMKADKTIRVGYLLPNEALELFRYCVGEATWIADREIPQLANRVVEACLGLPLALIVVGRTMLGKIHPQKWKDVIEILSKDLPRSSEMASSVFPVLKASYENLNGDILRTCFLYFSVFSEAHNLKKEELIELWIAEGFLADHNGMHHSWEEGEQLLAEKKKMGEDIIRSLKDACLLDTGKSTNSIMMHDITHAMTQLLAREEGNEENKVVVQKGEIDFAKWNDAERLSLWGPGIYSVSQTPSCYRLTTLMVRATKLKTFPSKLFPAMPGLRVLNLSCNEDLVEVPGDIGRLKLLYLNMSRTSIKVLPLEFKNLTCLEVLLLDNTRCLETIPSEVIRGLLSLQVFSRTLEGQQRFYPKACAEGGILDGLEMLEHVYEIRITLSSADSIQRLLNSPKLWRCIKLLLLTVRTNDTALKLSPARIEHLKRDELQDCRSVPEIQFVEEELQAGIPANIPRNFVGQERFTNLTHVDVWNCPVDNMSWLAYAPKLQILRLAGCPEIVEVVGEAVEDIFSNLTHLTLEELPKLERISKCNLPFPCLWELHVYGCPNLRKLPFDCESAKILEEIRGQRIWWERLEWTSKAVFSPKFSPIVSEQRIVIQVRMKCPCNACHIKARKLVDESDGVKSMATEGDNMLKIMFIGDEVDAVSLITSLKEKIGTVEIISDAADHKK